MGDRHRPRRDPLLRYAESPSALQLVIRRPNTRYFDHFLELRCATDLLALRLFPNAKEITETFGAIRACFRHSGLDPHDTKVHAVCVGDGVTPRTAATLAFRTQWTCLAVDPLMRDADKWPTRVRRLYAQARLVEDVEADFHRSPVVVLSVHAHVELETAIDAIRDRGGAVIAAVAIPCCGYQHEAPGLTLQAEYEDWAIWSPDRLVRAWSTSARA